MSDAKFILSQFNAKFSKEIRGLGFQVASSSVLSPFSWHGMGEEGGTTAKRRGNWRTTRARSAYLKGNQIESMDVFRRPTEFHTKHRLRFLKMDEREWQAYFVNQQQGKARQ